MLAIGCDQGGYGLKLEVMKYLDSQGIEYKDCGTYSADSVDYPVYARAVVKEILSGACEKGILICGTGIGVSIVANRYKGIRAALCALIRPPAASCVVRSCAKVRTISREPSRS